MALDDVVDLHRRIDELTSELDRSRQIANSRGTTILRLEQELRYFENELKYARDQLKLSRDVADRRGAELKRLAPSRKAS